MSRITPSRKLAAQFLVGAVAVFALNHWWFLGSGEFYPIVVWGAPLFAFLAAGSLVDPRLMLALEGREYPASLRVVAVVLAAAGLVFGIVLHRTFYGM
jgi:hypothetical protein